MAAPADALKDVPLFRDLPRKSLDRIAKVAQPVTYPAGQVVFREGDDGLGFFIITAGKVSIARGGKELVQLDTGGYFGEMALLDNAKRSATVTAVANTSCVEISRKEFLAELKNNPDMTMEILATMSRRVRDLDSRVKFLENSMPSEWLA